MEGRVVQWNVHIEGLLTMQIRRVLIQSEMDCTATTQTDGFRLSVIKS
jgi:hypothetical protein